jgi:metallo-beta-lactamase class B
MFHLVEKRAARRTGGANPFVVPGELAAYVAGLEREFDDELARQRAALR